MAEPERSGHVIHQPSGDIFVTITGKDPELTTAEIKFSSPEGGSLEDFGAILDLVEAEAPKPKGKLMRLASAIINLEKPEMTEEGKRKGRERIEKAMEKKFGK